MVRHEILGTLLWIFFGILLGVTISYANHGKLQDEFAKAMRTMEGPALRYALRNNLFEVNVLEEHDEYDEDGHVELVANIWVRHEYSTVKGRRVHMVSTLDTCPKQGERATSFPIVFFHGRAQSWFAFSQVMSESAERGYCCYSIDLLGYGQSDTNTTGSFKWRDQAQLFATMFKNDDRFKKVGIVAHDRGAVVADYLSEHQDNDFQIVAYARAQHPFLVESKLGIPMVLHDPRFSHLAMLSLHEQSALARPLNSDLVDERRFGREYSFKGVWRAADRAHRDTDEYLLHRDRCGHTQKIGEDDNDEKQHPTHPKDISCVPSNGGLLAHLVNIPMLLMQGALDETMPPPTYYNVPDVLPKANVRFLNCKWFVHLECFEQFSVALHIFFTQNGITPIPVDLDGPK